MGAAVAGIWELGWTTPIMEADLWRFLLRDFGVEDWWMTPISGIAARQVSELSTMEEILELNRGHRRFVFVDEEAELELAGLEHPEEALYIFGKAGTSPFKTHRRPEDLAVRIGTPAGAGLLWPHQAAGIVLHHRSSG